MTAWSFGGGVTKSGSGEVCYEPFLESHVEGLVALCRELEWPSYTDRAVARGAFSAPGAVTWVAGYGAEGVEGPEIVGVAHLLTNGHVHAHLSLVGVLPAYRRRGIARELIRQAFRGSGAKWLDLISEPGSEAFYRSFPSQEWVGFRIYPVDPHSQPEGGTADE